MPAATAAARRRRTSAPTTSHAEAYSADRILAELRALLPELRRRHPIASLAAGSDVDVLVEFDGPIGWRIVTPEDELSRHLGARADLVPRRSLRPGIGERVFREAIPV